VETAVEGSECVEVSLPAALLLLLDHPPQLLQLTVVYSLRNQVYELHAYPHLCLRQLLVIHNAEVWDENASPWWNIDQILVG